MISQLGFQNLLRSKLEEAQKKNASFSLRSFAVKLGIAAGPLSQILKGKRKVSEKLATQILDRLEIDLSTRAKAMIKSQILQEGDAQPTEDDAHPLPEDQFRLIADWYHYAILSLMLVKDFKNHTSWIAGRLGISENQVQDAISRMKRLEMIQETPLRKLKRTHTRMKTPDNIASDSLKKAHAQTLELARQSLLKHSVDERDFIHLTVPTNLAQIQKAKLYLRKVQDDLCEILMDTPDKTEVYRLSFELFPLTQLKSGAET